MPVPRPLAFYFLLNIMFICNFSVCSSAVIRMSGCRQKTSKQNPMSRRQSSWRGGGLISNGGKWPGLERRKVWGWGLPGVPGQVRAVSVVKTPAVLPARQHTRLHTPWPPAKCKVKCGSNETCPIHHLKKRTEGNELFWAPTLSQVLLSVSYSILGIRE